MGGVLRGLALLLAFAPAPAAARGDVSVATTDELRRALAAAGPGTRVLVAPGDYEGFYAAEVRGAEGRPVVLAAADPAHPPVFRGGVQLCDFSHVEVSGLRIEGAPANGLNVDDGGTFDTPAHHVVLRDLAVIGCGRRGNEDGIKLSGLDDFRLERCTVERWGRGGSAVDMVGCHRGRIEDCTFRDRAEDPAASGVQAKGGTRELVIRRSRFEHAGERAVNLGGSTALAYFCPKPEGFEAKDVTIEGCTFVGSEAPIAFVGVDGALVRFNTFYRPRKWLLRILQETRAPGFVPCRNGAFTDNLVAWRSDEVAAAVNVGPATAPETFTFARTWWWCLDAPGRGPLKLPVAEQDPAGGADPLFRDAEQGDLRLGAPSPARAHGAGALPAPPPR
jgi:hypothetical protein